AVPLVRRADPGAAGATARRGRDAGARAAPGLGSAPDSHLLHDHRQRRLRTPGVRERAALRSEHAAHRFPRDLRGLAVHWARVRGALEPARAGHRLRRRVLARRGVGLRGSPLRVRSEGRGGRMVALTSGGLPALDDPGGLGVAAGGAVRGDGLDAHVGVTDLGRVAGSGGAPSLMEHLSAAPDEADAAQDRVRREMDSAVAQLERGPTDRAMPDALHGAGEEVAASDGLEQLVPGWARSGDVHDLIAERQLVILIMDVATGGEAG